MAPLRLNDADSASLQAVLLLQRYSRGLNRVTDRWLGDEGTDNTDMQILLAVLAGDGVGPSEVVASIGMPRSTVARGLARLIDRGFVERRTQPVDHRRASLHVTARGRRGIGRLERAMADFFRDEEPLVKELLLLLGHDPEPTGAPGAAPAMLDVLSTMGAWGAAYLADLRALMRPFGADGRIEHHTVTMLAQGWARPTQLADELALSPAGTTSLLERLETAGLLVREPGALDSDRRAVLVHLTPRGRRAARTLLGTFQQHQDSLVDLLRLTLLVR